jgi:hypothetical protein
MATEYEEDLVEAATRLRLLGRGSIIVASQDRLDDKAVVCHARLSA